MLKLVIYHNIFLNKQQRYLLHKKVDIDTVGVSVPTWYLGNQTSEPSKEIFCKYYLKNPHKDISTIICEDGYIIYLPHVINQTKKEMLDEEWRNLTEEERDIYYLSFPRNMTCNSLLDYKDGGSKSLIYKEHNKVKVENSLVDVTHYINIFDINVLESTISF